MTLDDFIGTLADTTPPRVSQPALLALWHDGRENWEAAHRVAQDIDDATGAWVHAYLHRKEGDAGNAAYWYARARKPVSNLALADEWREIVTAMLSRAS